MKHLLGLIAIDGINNMIATGTLPRLLPHYNNDAEANHYLGICVILFGVGEITGGYFGGSLCDRYSLKRVIFSLLLLYCVVCANGFIGWYAR